QHRPGSIDSAWSARRRRNDAAGPWTENVRAVTVRRGRGMEVASWESGRTSSDDDDRDELPGLRADCAGRHVAVLVRLRQPSGSDLRAVLPRAAGQGPPPPFQPQNARVALAADPIHV